MVNLSLRSTVTTAERGREFWRGVLPVSSEPVETATSRPRIIGVDVARGLALFGMMAVHVYDSLDNGNHPTAAWVIAGGRSAATFVLIAGVSLAFMSGGRTAVHGRDRLAVSAGLTVRALLIGAIGLVLGFWDTDTVDVILAYYGLMFLLALPILAVRPKVLALVSAGFLLLGPVVLVATARAGLDYTPRHVTLATLVNDPAGLLTQLLLTGFYPLAVYLAFLCAGIAIGRLDLHSPRVAWRLLSAGIGLAVTAQLVSFVLLHPLGGLGHLLAQTGSPGSPTSKAELLWDPAQGTSWWYLAVPAPHANTPIDVAHTLGSAMAVLGAALLLTRVAAIRGRLRAVADAGTMTLTLYSAHVLLLATGLLSNRPLALFLLMVIAALLFAVVWRRWRGQGPLEGIVARAAAWTRRSVLRATCARTAMEI